MRASVSRPALTRLVRPGLVLRRPESLKRNQSSAASQGSGLAAKSDSSARQWTQHQTIQQVVAGHAAKPAGSNAAITVKGWVRSVRSQKQVAFVDLNDGSAFWNLQVVMPPEMAKK